MCTMATTIFTEHMSPAFLADSLNTLAADLAEKMDALRASRARELALQEQLGAAQAQLDEERQRQHRLVDLLGAMNHLRVLERRAAVAAGKGVPAAANSCSK